MLKIKPVEGQIALQLLDDGDDDHDESTPSAGTSGPESEDSYRELIYAIVVGLGPKPPSGVKEGDTVLVRKYARDAPRVSEDVVICDTDCLVATVRA